MTENLEQKLAELTEAMKNLALGLAAQNQLNQINSEINRNLDSRITALEKVPPEAN